MSERSKRTVKKKRGTTVGLPNFVPIVERYKQAVVGIEVVHEPAQTRLFPIGPLWHDGSPSYRSVNIGTGFIFDPQGHILTNEHVIHSASQVLLRFYGRKRPVRATIVGTDYVHDIAILKTHLAAPKLILRIAKPEDICVGEWVVAIGSPLGLDHSVTAGIISSKDRPLKIGDREYPKLIQTDAAINRGNSGGPLINMRGQVIGMNTAVSQSSQGIGFAISAEVLRESIAKIL
ncbi:S1C family serine protease [Alicyclobacillus kakegawensis]|uniref:S1C family serine protease n=1 Tax=Alicyclobacillus kakegawensis TaxID=392012 RepID=UPI0008364894|nr:trypsin-like peptidase domain-containing protein [Alicyclobacillus kakegawensis]